MDKIDLRNIERRKKNRYSFYLNDEDKEIFLKKIEAEKRPFKNFCITEFLKKRR